LYQYNVFNFQIPEIKFANKASMPTKIWHISLSF
jgi:hypothetical protein